MAEGVTIVDPASTFIGPDVTVGPDTIIRPGVHLEGKTRVGAGCEIHSGVRIVDSTIDRVGEIYFDSLAMLVFLLLVARFGFGLTGLNLAVLVMMAALPVGTNALLFAQRYGVPYRKAGALFYTVANWLLARQGAKHRKRSAHGKQPSEAQDAGSGSLQPP